MSEPVAVAIAHAYRDHVDEYAQVNADRSFATPLLDRLAELVPGGGVVGDLGCGPGWETGALASRGFRAVGLDVTPAFLAHAARSHPATGYLAGDFLTLPFRDGTLDGAWACSSLVHVPWLSIGSALAEVARVLRNGGAFLSTMQAGSVEGPLGSRTFPGKLFHYAYYEPDDWRATSRPQASKSYGSTTTNREQSTATLARMAGSSPWRSSVDWPLVPNWSQRHRPVGPIPLAGLHHESVQRSDDRAHVIVGEETRLHDDEAAVASAGLPEPREKASHPAITRDQREGGGTRRYKNVGVRRVEQRAAAPFRQVVRLDIRAS